MVSLGKKAGESYAKVARQRIIGSELERLKEIALETGNVGARQPRPSSLGAR